MNKNGQHDRIKSIMDPTNLSCLVQPGSSNLCARYLYFTATVMSRTCEAWAGLPASLLCSMYTFTQLKKFKSWFFGS